jgi:glycolate oxidase
MGLLGVSTLAELDRTYLKALSYAGPSHVLSAFPHLSLEDRAFY